MLYKKLLFLASLVSINMVVVAEDPLEFLKLQILDHKEKHKQNMDVAQKQQESGYPARGAMIALGSAAVYTLKPNCDFIMDSSFSEGLRKEYLGDLKQCFPDLQLAPCEIVLAMVGGLKHKSEEELLALQNKVVPGVHPLTMTRDFAKVCVKIQSGALKKFRLSCQK